MSGFLYYSFFFFISSSSLVDSFNRDRLLSGTGELAYKKPPSPLIYLQAEKRREKRGLTSQDLGGRATEMPTTTEFTTTTLPPSPGVTFESATVTTTTATTTTKTPSNDASQKVLDKAKEIAKKIKDIFEKVVIW